MNPYTMPIQLTNIYKFCNSNTRTSQSRGGINANIYTCSQNKSLPLSKTTNLNTSTNISGQTKKMAYSQWVNTNLTNKKFVCLQ